MSSIAGSKGGICEEEKENEISGYNSKDRPIKD